MRRGLDAGAVVAGSNAQEAESGRAQRSIVVFSDGDAGKQESLEAHVLARVQEQNAGKYERAVRCWFGLALVRRRARDDGCENEYNQ